ncbi:hypothetical protein AMTRI_Chr07g80470 [Amborella trichopoda]
MEVWQFHMAFQIVASVGGFNGWFSMCSFDDGDFDTVSNPVVLVSDFAIMVLTEWFCKMICRVTCKVVLQGGFNMWFLGLLIDYGYDTMREYCIFIDKLVL